jgi:hypothetical protein
MEEVPRPQFTAQEINDIRDSRRRTIESLKKGRMIYKEVDGIRYPEVTGEQQEKAHKMMELEFRAREKIVKRLKRAQP